MYRTRTTYNFTYEATILTDVEMNVLILFMGSPFFAKYTKIINPFLYVLTMLPKLIQIARKTRKWAMRNRKYFPKKLTGMCAIASHRISKHLSDEKIHHKIVVTDEHVWIEVGYYVIDVTATQFGNKFPPVLVVGRNEYIKLISHHVDLPGNRFASRDMMEKFLISRGWKEDQIPNFRRQFTLPRIE